MERILRSDWMRANPYIGAQIGIWTKFYLIPVDLGRYTLKLLLTEIAVHTGNICSDLQDACTLLRLVHMP